MSDEEHTEDEDGEAEETVMDEAAGNETVMNEEESKGEDATAPLSASEYLNPPERKWVLPIFIGMFVAYFAYYWFTYLGTL